MKKIVDFFLAKDETGKYDIGLAVFMYVFTPIFVTFCAIAGSSIRQGTIQKHEQINKTTISISYSQPVR